MRDSRVIWWLWICVLVASMYAVSSGPVLATMRTNPHCYIIGVTSVKDAGIGVIYYPLILVCRRTGWDGTLVRYAAHFRGR